MDKNSIEFAISQQIIHHEKAIRSIDTIGNIALTGSMDKSCAFFDIDQNGKYHFVNESKLHDDYTYKVFALRNKSGFLTASKDKRIIMMDLLGNPIKEFIGHEGAVNSLSQYKEDTFISGSWDGTARIWNIESGQTVSVLKDHSYAVAVCAFPNNVFITGSQDKRLRFWIRDHNTKNVDNAHEDIIRDITPNTDHTSFYTCSNDCTIKLWSMLGQCLLTLSGHEGFIFRVIPFGDYLFSAGDDKVVKVWYGNKFIMDLFHPNTVWDAAINSKGELLTACGDGVLRVFTNDKDKWLSKEEIDVYNNLCLVESNKSQNEEAKDSNLSVNQLPSIEYIYKNKGKEGELRAFNNNGKGECWMFKEGKWEKIGDVIGGEDNGNNNKGNHNQNQSNSTIGTKYYPGDRCFPAGEYDFIFDVELDHKTTKLPFNYDGNKLVAAQKFCKREDLHVGYQDDIIKFLQQNSKQKPVKQVTKVEKEGVGQFASNLLNLVKLPVTTFYIYNTINIEGPMKKLQDENFKTQFLDEQGMKSLNSLLKKVKETQFYHTTKFTDQEKQCLSLLFKFGYEVFIFDICRMICLHPSANELFKGETIVYLFSLCLKGVTSDVDNVKIISMRTLVNIMSVESGRIFIMNKRQELLDTISVNIDSLNKNIKNALAAMLLNLSILFYDKQDNEAAVQLLSLISESFSTVKPDDDIKNVNNLLIALGNMIFNSNSNLSFSKELEILGLISSLGISSNDAIFIEMTSFLTAALK